MPQKIEYIYDRDDDSIVNKIKAKDLADGDFFSFNKEAFIFDGVYSSFIDTIYKIRRLSDMKSFTIHPDEIVAVYKEISIKITRI